MKRVKLIRQKRQTAGYLKVFANSAKKAGERMAKRGTESLLVGADPGVTGAIAFIGEDYKAVIDMPSVAKSTGKGNQVDQYTLCGIIREHAQQFHIDIAYIEKVSAMPDQGVTGVFSFGRSMGCLETAFAAAFIPVVLVLPRVWKGAAKLIKKDKDVARILAMQKYPELADRLSRKMDHNRADAILIAHYGKFAE